MAPVGKVVTISVARTIVEVAGVRLKVTIVALVNFVQKIFTVPPTLPDVEAGQQGEAQANRIAPRRAYSNGRS